MCSMSMMAFSPSKGDANTIIVNTEPTQPTIVEKMKTHTRSDLARKAEHNPIPSQVSFTSLHMQ